MTGQMTDHRFAPGILELVPDALTTSSRQPVPRSAASSGLKLWEGEQCLEVCRSPVLRNQYQRWQAARRSGMPLLKDVYASVEEADLEDAMLLLQIGGDFIYVFQGSGSVRCYGRLVRGSLMSENEGPQVKPLREIYNRTISLGVPIYIQFVSDSSSNHISWERMLLPVFGDRRAASRFLLTYSAPLDDKFEILTTVFERSPIGMIAACTANGTHFDQARILMINGHARELLKLPREGRPISTVHELWTWIADVAHWQRLSQSTAGERTKLVYADGDRRHVVMIEPLGRFAVMHLIEMDGTH